MSNNNQQLPSATPTRISGFHSVLSIASYYAQITGANSIALGITRDQIDAIPNIREALDLFQQHVRLLNPSLGDFHILTPFAALTKTEIVRRGDELNVPFVDTWSCLYGNTEHCGKCIQCRARRDAFSASSVNDPTTYAS